MSYVQIADGLPQDDLFRSVIRAGNIKEFAYYDSDSTNWKNIDGGVVLGVQSYSLEPTNIRKIDRLIVAEDPFPGYEVRQKVEEEPEKPMYQLEARLEYIRHILVVIYKGIKKTIKKKEAFFINLFPFTFQEKSALEELGYTVSVKDGDPAEYYRVVSGWAYEEPEPEPEPTTEE